ncbi:TIGR03067 domain-containing protein [Tuwongella immobilis]|uniref:Lipocalin-like domain-containing protein n=1 Tax=Tuwongella immobilis TaxID=692036 RepID=A0A6C2YP07_9BACT|nr:TIGR03067 domain-containing protein [Tuwongella immobilis]VIP02929.1 unnamed protein product [Tuwongella immobilis]VTS02875.1 unnamed protein product [Tuwongella immobilis]
MVRSAAWIVLSLVVSLSHFLRPAHADDAAIAKEQAKLNGIWVLTSIEFQGKDVEHPGNGKMEHHFDGTRLKINLDLRPMISETLFYRIDPSTSPKMIDVGTTTDGFKTKTEMREGIYEIKGDQLLWALHIKDGVNGLRERPTEFKTDAESNIIIYKLKRISD